MVGERRGVDGRADGGGLLGGVGDDVAVAPLGDVASDVGAGGDPRAVGVGDAGGIGRVLAADELGGGVGRVHFGGQVVDDVQVGEVGARGDLGEDELGASVFVGVDVVGGSDISGVYLEDGDDLLSGFVGELHVRGRERGDVALGGRRVRRVKDLSFGVARRVDGREEHVGVPAGPEGCDEQLLDGPPAGHGGGERARGGAPLGEGRCGVAGGDGGVVGVEHGDRLAAADDDVEAAARLVRAAGGRVEVADAEAGGARWDGEGLFDRPRGAAVGRREDVQPSVVEVDQFVDAISVEVDHLDLLGRFAGGGGDRGDGVGVRHGFPIGLRVRASRAAGRRRRDDHDAIRRIVEAQNDLVLCVRSCKFRDRLNRQVRPRASRGREPGQDRLFTLVEHAVSAVENDVGRFASRRGVARVAARARNDKQILIQIVVKVTRDHRKRRAAVVEVDGRHGREVALGRSERGQQELVAADHVRESVTVEVRGFDHAVRVLLVVRLCCGHRCANG